MYIKNIAMGSQDNFTDKMLGLLDMDANPIYTNSGHTATYTPSLYQNGLGIAIRINHTRMGYNSDVIASIGLGNVLDSRYSIFPFQINFNNSALGAGTSQSDIEFTEVDISGNAPDNWDIDRYQYYFTLEYDGQNKKHHAAIPAGIDWETLKADLIANNKKLYRNEDICKWFYVGSGEHKISFILGRCDGTASGSSADNETPALNVYTRNVSGDYYFSGGYIRNGTTPESPAVLPSGSYGSGQFSVKTLRSVVPNSIDNAFISGRFTSNVTNDNPITDCTMLQFGIVQYNGKKYFGTWIVTYAIKYYWGYPLISGTTWNLANLDTSMPVSYTEDMEKYSLEFYGICLDELDVEIETEDGEIPPEVNPDGDYQYPSFPHRFLDTQSFGILADATSAGFHVYRLTSSDFNKLASQIWNWGNIVNNVLTQIEDKGLIKGAIDAATSSIIQSKLSPSDCIVFARKMPYAVTNPPAGILDSLFSLRLGGQYLDVQGNAYLAERIVRTVATNWQFTGPTKTFLDMGSNVSVSIMLPYVGTVQIPADAVMDGHLDISYAFDIISGQCGVQIITTARDGRQQTYGTYTGAPSVNIPLAIADSNITGRQIATARAAVNGIAGAIKGYSTGGLIGRGGVVSSLIGAAAAIAEEQAAPADFNQVTSLGTDSAIISPCDILIQITYPATVDLQNTINLIGACAYKTGRVADFVSPDMDKPTRFSYIDTDGITATAEELAMIEQVLKEGVYL